MDDKRLVKHAVKVQFLNGDMSNLLADAPPTSSFQQLVKLVANRKKWKQIWARKFGTATAEVRIKWNDSAPSTSERFLPTPKTPAPKPMTETDKENLRHAHANLFNPAGANPNQNSRRRVRRKTKPKGLTGTAVLTDKQRKTWARDHFELHHGKSTAKFFEKTITTNTTTTTGSPTTNATTSTSLTPTTSSTSNIPTSD